jgi:ATP-dependent Lon protease
MNMDNNDFKISITKKKNKNFKSIVSLYKKLSNLINQLDFLFKNKFILQDFYIDSMQLLNDIYTKIYNYEELNDKKRVSKISIDNLLNDINLSLQKICNKIGSNNCKNTLDVYFIKTFDEKYSNIDSFLEDQNDEYNYLFNLYNEYFVPLSSNKILEVNIDKFMEKMDIKDNIYPQIVKIIEYSKANPLTERIHGASIIFLINNKIIYINGYFNNDPLNIFKNYNQFKNKSIQIEEQLEYIDVPADFKEKYLEQLSLKEFLVNSPTTIANIIKDDYNDFLSYKNKSLSLLIKEFIKCNIEKQRKIILLLLISDQESQFTAHIIFDLITDKALISESMQLSELLFNSFHWKIQKIFKISNDNFENHKNKLENMNINNIPYESRILALKTTDNIKAKANEKLKEINGSKDNSIKAQQWLDGFLKIPFNTFKKEHIIDFFKNYQLKIEKYIDVFTIKISEYNIDKLNVKSKTVYNIIIQIIDEYHSNIHKSENTYGLFIKYLENIKSSIESVIGLSHENKSKNQNKIDEVIKVNSNENSIFLLDNYDNTSVVIEDIIKNNVVPDEEAVNECISQLSHFKKVKNELYENNIINENNIGIMVKKLNELECMLNINLLKNEAEYNENDDQYEDKKDNNYNVGFIKYIYKNLDEFDTFIKEWSDFKIKKKDYIEEVDKILEKCTYGQTCAKNQMKRIIGQWMNGNTKGQCFGLHGPPGVGKTTLCKNGLAKCLFDEYGESRPFAFLPLGGATNGSILEGHHYTYLGSTWGKIVDILMETKCMNPIIYIDELDKISKTEHGKEIISILTHITDASQNKEYYDRYFASIPIDLSQVLFIFSYNDRDSIDRVLLDRIQEIEIKALSVKEKLVISQNYIIPEILNNVGFSINEVFFNEIILTKIINEYTYEAGVRKLNEILYDIIRDINLKKIMECDNIEYPIIIDENITKDVLAIKPQITIKKIHDKPSVGLINGLYATNSGLGGLTIIQVMKVNSDKKFSLEKLTGNQGDVMKESMSCAMTLAWNIIPDNIKNSIYESKENWGIHIHCPSAGTPKDGPSGGLAITLGIISRLTNIPIKNTVAMTGEVDLLGNSCEIGGLYSKLAGALNAGVKQVLIPYENKKDLEIIFKKEEEEQKNMIKITKSKQNLNSLLLEDYKDDNKIYFRSTMEIIYVNNIFEVLKHGLVENDLVFNTNF